MAKATISMNKMKGTPWLRIWTHPRDTIRSIIRKNPKYRFMALSAIYGFSSLLALMQGMSMGHSMPVMAIVLVALVLSPFIGMIEITAISWLLQWTGRWIGGAGDFQNIRASVAWSNVPHVGVIVFWALLMAVFGADVFYIDFNMMPIQGGLLTFMMTMGFFKLVFAVWGFVLLLITLSEVQRFPIWKAFINVLMPFVIVMVVLWFLSVICWGGSCAAM